MICSTSDIIFSSDGLQTNIHDCLQYINKYTFGFWCTNMLLVYVTLVHLRTQYTMNHIWPLSLHNIFLHSFCFLFFVLLMFVTLLWLVFVFLLFLFFVLSFALFCLFSYLLVFACFFLFFFFLFVFV